MSKIRRSALRQKSTEEEQASMSGGQTVEIRPSEQVHQVTMQDIAARCNLSKVTISRTFTAPNLVKESTRELVFSVAEEMGYTYNALAATVGKATQPFLGFIISHTNDSQFQRIMRLTLSAAIDRGLEVLLGVTELVHEKEMALIHRYFEYRAAAIIVFGPTLKLAGSAGKFISKALCPILILGEASKSDKLNYIGVDIEQVTFAMTEHLIRLGHRKIAVVTGPHKVACRSFNRIAGYARAMKQHGLPVDPRWSYSTTSGLPNTVTDLVDAGHQAVLHFLECGSRPTAIIFPADILALGGILTLKAKGFAVPGDISVVSMSEQVFGSWVEPALTTLRISQEDQAAYARKFLEDAAARKVVSQRYSLPAEIIVRDSSAPPPFA